MPKRTVVIVNLCLEVHRLILMMVIKVTALVLTITGQNTASAAYGKKDE